MMSTNDNDNNLESEQLRELMNRVGLMAQDIERLKNEFAKWIKEMQDGLNRKADTEALNMLEKTILDKLSELVKAFTK